MWSSARRTKAWWLGLLILLGATIGMASGVRAQGEAQAAPPPLNIALLVDSDTDRCFDRGYVAAIERLTAIERDKINAAGGIHGRPVELVVLDSKRDADLSIASMRTALAAPHLLAMIGLTSSTLAEKVFAATGTEIGKSGVPFISHISVEDIIKTHANVFSTRPSQEQERVPVMEAFVAQMGLGNVAFIGRKGAPYIDAIGDGLKNGAISNRVVADHRITRNGNGRRGVLDEAELDRAIADLRGRGVELVVVAVGTAQTGGVLEKLKTAGLTPAIMMIGSVERLPPATTKTYPNAIYQLDWDAIPEVSQDSVRSVVTRSNPEDWVFEGTKLAGAPDWKEGKCPEDYLPQPFSDTNLRAIGLGAQFADMVGLAATAARKTERTATLAMMRQRILQDLGTTYSAGRGAYKGRFENWSFYPGSRVRAQTPFVHILPQGLGRTQLAPMQFVRTRGGKLRRIDTLYLDIDLIRAHTIDNNEKSFFAEFYLAMRATDRVGIKDVTFTNAFVDPRTNGPHLSFEIVHPGGPSDAYPESMRIYRITGKFRFSPDFEAYPFDSQQFSIDIQPKNDDKPFLVQSPPHELRDKGLAVDGWQLSNQYVSYVHDFVPVVDAFTHEPSIVPFYKTRFVWQLKRETTDYYLRVVIPLAFILIVAYLSIFIPQSHIEAIVTIQVTALLSAVALYLSLPQVDSDTATVSDRIFVIDYMMVSLMIVISILRINARVVKLRWLNNTLTFIHIAVIPAMVVVLVGLTLRAFSLGPISHTMAVESLRGLAKLVMN